MKKQKSRLLAVVLLCTLILSVSASALGSCGDNLTWEIDSYSLIISGTGPMVCEANPPAWARAGFHRLTINEGCTSIAPEAFSYYHSQSLRFVTLPSTLTQIGEKAFYLCTYLWEINLEHVSVIGKNAFECCYGLKEIHFSEKLREIGYGAFSNCHQMHTVTLKDGVTTIGDYAFEKCRALRVINIPGSVKYIGDGAFSDAGVKEIHFEGYPPEFGDKVFENVSAAIYYPAGLPEWKEIPALQGNFNFVPVSCQTHSIVPLPGRAPTCAQEGLTEGTGCSVCMLAETAQQTIPKTAHTYGAWVNNDAPNPTDWAKKRTCSDCGHEDIIAPAQPDSNTPDPAVPQSPTESTPVQDATENSTPVTDNSTPATAPMDTSTDTDGSKNALLFVGIGVVLLGLATSGIFFIKPKFTQKKAE